MSIIKCCKDCSRRELGCHSTCEQYIAQKNAWDKAMQLKRKASVADGAESQRIQMIEKSVRKLMKQRRGY